MIFLQFDIAGPVRTRLDPSETIKIDKKGDLGRFLGSKGRFLTKKHKNTLFSLKNGVRSTAFRGKKGGAKKVTFLTRRSVFFGNPLEIAASFYVGPPLFLGSRAVFDLKSLIF